MFQNAPKAHAAYHRELAIVAAATTALAFTLILGLLVMA